MKKNLLPLVLVCACFHLHGATAPWKMIYSNDTTNILVCDSPYHRRGDNTFDEEKIRMSVREAAVKGMGAQLLQPGTSWVPWWRSTLVPLKEHEQWFRAHFGIEPSVPMHRFLLEGGDLIDTFAAECLNYNIDAIVSFRANDSHLQEYAFAPLTPSPGMAGCISRFYVEHPEYRRGSLSAIEWKDRNHNWAIPEARAYKEALLWELIENYPKLAGVEIDFMRHPFYFPDSLPLSRRVSIMTDFIKKARAALDEVAKKTNGKHRYLGVRVPMSATEWKDVGLEPKAWENAGVDYFNLSPSYCTTQQTDIAKVRAAVSRAAIYAELTHTAMTWRMGGEGYDDHNYRRMTKEALESTARLFYARGADGVSLFNFVYYRAHGGYREYKGPFDEPPFAALEKLAQRKQLEQDAPAYFFLWARDVPFERKTTRSFEMDMLPKGTARGVLRILVLTQNELPMGETEQPEKIDRGKWTVKLNGSTLTAKGAASVAYPYPTDIKAGFNHAAQYLEFDVPAGAIKNNRNEISVTSIGISQTMHLRWIEVVQQ